jgi:outer membrane protein assembly factor BamB
MSTLIARLLPVAVATAACCLWCGWSLGGGATLAERLPGADRPAGSVAVATVDLKGSFATGPGWSANPVAPAGAGTTVEDPDDPFGGAIAAPAVPDDSWPGFRGPNRDNVAPTAPRLLDSFPAGGPKALWSVAVGYGYAGAAVRDGRVFILDYDVERQADALRCLSLADGAEIWRRSYAVRVKFNHGMSRTVPAVSDRYVVTLGPKCHVLCVAAATGDFLWGLDLVREYQTKEPPWYAGQCPLIDGDRAILAPAGETALLVALDCATGRPVWTTPNTPGWSMTHSSVQMVTLGGVRQYVYCGNGGVAGVAAADGALLWTTDAWKVNIATVPTPVPVGDDRLLLCGGYGAGCLMVRVTRDGEKWRTETVFRLAAAEFGSDQQTPVCYRGCLYGVIPDGQLVCLDLEGQRVWASGPANRFGLGPYLIADGKIWLLNDTGTLTVARASPAGYEQLAQAKVLDGHDAWGPMALAGSRLLARDLSRMVCLDIGKEGP